MQNSTFKTMPGTIEHNEYLIELIDEPRYEEEATRPASAYDAVYQPENDGFRFPSRYGIKVYTGGQLVKSVLIVGIGGAPCIGSDSALIDDNNLIISCGNKLYNFSIPQLTLNWETEVDWATCFSVHAYGNTYITHGEVDIARLDKQGNILWQFTGADIFVSMDGDVSFTMHNDHIALVDFNGSKYNIDYDGQPIN